MNEIKIIGAWHIGEIASYLHDVVRETGKPAFARFQGDYTIMMIPDTEEDTKIVPDWKERPEVHSL